MSTDGQPAGDGRLAGDELPKDALDLASEQKAYLVANPHDNTAVEAMRDVRRVIDQVQGDAPIEWSTWKAHPDEPSPRRWLVQNWLPAGRVALFTGPGGVGKSRLVLQLAAAIASGGGDGDTWIETPDVDILRLGNGVSSDGDCVVYASWEDEPEGIYRRLADISGNPAPWATTARLDRLHLIDMAGLGPIWAPERGRHISTLAEITAAGQKVRRHCEEYGARILILDPLAAAYAGDENARGSSEPSYQTGTPGGGSITAPSFWWPILQSPGPILQGLPTAREQSGPCGRWTRLSGAPGPSRAVMTALSRGSWRWRKATTDPLSQLCTWTGTPLATVSVGRCWGHGTTSARS